MTISTTIILKEETKLAPSAFWHAKPVTGAPYTIYSVDLDKFSDGRTTIQTDSPAQMRRLAAALIEAAEMGEAIEGACKETGLIAPDNKGEAA
ncbi:hypothetical protein [Hwanghaeella sp.]|uniref:hypothetical protein n=1 Tax=Hwanghaeella sp. TaxID=2605943 RepID=UPI003CCC33C7